MCLAQMFGIFARYTKELKFILAEYIYEIFVEMTKKTTLKKQFNAILHKEIFQLWLIVSKKKMSAKSKIFRAAYYACYQDFLLQDKCLQEYKM